MPAGIRNGETLPFKHKTAKKKGEAIDCKGKGNMSKGCRSGKRAHKNARVTFDEYEAMYNAYMKLPTVNNVSVVCKVSYKTAKRYIFKGEPKYGWKPIHERYLASVKKVDEKVERKYEDALVESKNIIQAVKSLHLQALKQVVEDPAKRAEWLDKVQKNPERFIAMFSQIMRDESFAFGGPDLRTENKNQQTIDFRKEAAKIEGDEELKEEMFSLLDKINKKIKADDAK